MLLLPEACSAAGSSIQIQTPFSFGIQQLSLFLSLKVVHVRRGVGMSVCVCDFPFYNC